MASDGNWMDVLWPVGIGLAAAGGAALLWWRVPKRQMRSITASDPKARADIEDNFRKTVGQALAGIAVLFGGVTAYLQFTQQQQAAHDLLISNQVSKGFELLGSGNLETRLGGIYALEGVMNGSETYRQPVLDALCAFIRAHTIGMIIDIQPAHDVQAALTAIGRRSNRFGQVYLNLRGIRAQGAILFHANLAGASLAGADLSGAILVNARLADANLAYANLSRAILINARLADAFLWDTNLTGANLTTANLTNGDLTNADLTDAKNLTQVQLDKACGKPKTLPQEPPSLTLDRPCPPKPAAPSLNSK